MAHRDFTAARAENAGEPITFNIGEHGPFTVARVPAGPLLDLASAANLQGSAALAAFGDFLTNVVETSQRDALRAALNTSDLSVVFEVTSWIIETAVARPFDEPSVSESSPSTNGAASKLAAATAGWNPSG